MEFNKSDIKYTTRMNVFTGRIDRAPESKLAPTFAGGRACVRRRQRQMDASVVALVPKLDDDANVRLFVLMVQF